MCVCEGVCACEGVSLLRCAPVASDAVDKRGRRSNKTSNEDLRKYYELDGKEEIGIPPSHGSDDITALSEEEDGESESELDDVINSEGESPSSSSESEEEVVLEGAGHRWAEPDPGVVFGEASSRRLAVCNMDWDRVSAEDIFGGWFRSIEPAD